MAHTLVFQAQLAYSRYLNEIALPIALLVGDRKVSLDATLDSGCTFCVFPRSTATALGLDLEVGHRTTFHTATGTVLAFGHGVTLRCAGLEFDIMTYFAADEGFSPRLLGRQGWLDRVRLALVHAEHTLYVSPHNEPDFA